MEQSIKIRADEAAAVFGAGDCHLKKIEAAFGVSIVNRGDDLKISGEAKNVEAALKAVRSLLVVAAHGDVSEQNVGYVTDMVKGGEDGYLRFLDSSCIGVTASGKPVKAKTQGQQDYIDAVASHTVTFAVGPAGTGKTYLAVALAVRALRQKEISRIVITRPAVEAGEKLGFLPGDLQEKVDPYLRPIHDALRDLLGPEPYQRLLERGTIEIAPLAYMRGRTLDDSFIILDEAQNTTPEQMKMFITRFGFGSRVVVTGDPSQTDLPHGTPSGLREAVRALGKVPEIAVMRLTGKDIVRHPLVQKIIEAYESFEHAKQKGREK